MGRRYEDWYNTDDCIEVDGGYYVTQYVHHHNIGCCEISGDYYSMDDLVSTSRGLVHQNEAVSLDVEDDDGNNYATPDDTMTTHDGRVIHRGNVVEHTVGDKVFICHDEDDLEALDEPEETALTIEKEAV